MHKGVYNAYVHAQSMYVCVQYVCAFTHILLCVHIYIVRTLFRSDLNRRPDD